MSIAILLSTCDTYAPVAHFTRAQLDACWPGHPPVWFCGLTTAADNFLPFTGDARDWVGITYQAVTALVARGVEWLYLILDDHPPFGPCNVEYLNNMLPKTAVRLGAIQINLQGWDQGQLQAGTALGAADLHCLRNAEDFRWKFSLHPGLWHVSTLACLLRQLRANQPDAISARAFESSMEVVARALDPGLCAQTYRIRGDGYARGRHWFERRNTRWIARQGIHVARWSARLAGTPTLERLDQWLMAYLHYYNGPYPMFWSGLISRGQLHVDALRFLEAIGETDVAQRIRSLPPVR